MAEEVEVARIAPRYLQVTRRSLTRRVRIAAGAQRVLDGVRVHVRRDDVELALLVAAERAHVGEEGEVRRELVQPEADRVVVLREAIAAGAAGPR